MGLAYAQFGNLRYDRIAGWSLDCQGGIEPSVCTITAVPHLNQLETDGTLTIGESGAGYLEIRDCKLLTPTLREDRKWDLPIVDRRWKWAFGRISGSYNLQRADGTFIREKTPQELAELCLTAMGERRGQWDIGQLPNYARPEVRWENDNPASALDDLVQSLGCVLTLDYFRDRVIIWPTGTGRGLPEGPTISRSFGLSALAKPDSIACYGSPTIYQARFATEAVGLDKDGEWKKLNELSYYDSLSQSDPNTFDDIEGTYNDNGEERELRDLVRDTVYRTYRITGLANGGWSPENLKGTPQEPSSFFDLQLLDSRAEQEIDPNDIGPDGKKTGRKVDKPPLVMARWYDSENDATPAAGELRMYKGNVSVDQRLGLIRFSDPVYLFEGDNTARDTIAAEVYVDIAFHAGKDGQLATPILEQKTGERNNTGPRVVIRPEIEQRIIQRYNKTAIATTQEVPSSVQSSLQHWIDAALSEYDEQRSVSRTYYGLLPIVPDGLVQQVTWSGGGGTGPRTQASVATSHNPYVASPADLRRQRVAQDAAKKFIALKRKLGWGG